jgi:hypothetical protein
MTLVTAVSALELVVSTAEAVMFDSALAMF